MSGETFEGQDPLSPPRLGTLMVDANGHVGEFRGEWCGHWSLRPIGGGTEWTVAEGCARPADAQQRLRAKAARANARSRGESA